MAHGKPNVNIVMQEILLDSFTLMKNYVFSAQPSPKTSQANQYAGTSTIKARGQTLGATSLIENVEKTKFDIQNMSGCDVIVKELSVKGLGSFTAYANKAIKVVFDDRTIIRMQDG